MKDECFLQSSSFISSRLFGPCIDNNSSYNDITNATSISLIPCEGHPKPTENCNLYIDIPWTGKKKIY